MLILKEALIDNCSQNNAAENSAITTTDVKPPLLSSGTTYFLLNCQKAAPLQRVRGGGGHVLTGLWCVLALSAGCMYI